MELERTLVGEEIGIDDRVKVTPLETWQARAAWLRGLGQRGAGDTHPDLAHGHPHCEMYILQGDFDNRMLSNCKFRV